jgi:hypothetical protein
MRYHTEANRRTRGTRAGSELAARHSAPAGQLERLAAAAAARQAAAIPLRRRTVDTTERGLQQAGESNAMRHVQSVALYGQATAGARWTALSGPVRRCPVPHAVASQPRVMSSSEPGAALDRSRHNHGTNAGEHGHGAMLIGPRSRRQNAVVCRRSTGVVAECRRDCTSSTSWWSHSRLQQGRGLHRKR